MNSSAFFYIPEPRPSAVRRFFAFHHAGGAAANYLKIRSLLPSDYELVLAELPGRGRLSHSAPFTEWSPMRGELLQALLPLHDRPSVFFGHSLGGLIAYELLMARGTTEYPKTLLAVSAVNAPSHLVRLPFKDDGPPTDTELVARIRDTGGAPSEILEIPGLIERYLPALRADFDLLKCYQPRKTPSPVRGSVVAYQPTNDPWITSQGMSHWAAHSGESFVLQFREGNHFYLFNQLPTLIAHICAHAENL